VWRCYWVVNKTRSEIAHVAVGVKISRLLAGFTIVVLFAADVKIYSKGISRPLLELVRSSIYVMEQHRLC
jgi:hypothetical protein